MGLATPIEAWEPQMEHIDNNSTDFQALIFDNIGSGLSSISSSSSSLFTHTIYSMAMDALDLVMHVGWKEFHLVGISMGGMIAQEIASRRPEFIQSLTLMNTHAGGIMKNFFPPLRGLYYLLAVLTAKNIEQRVELLKLLYSKASLSNPERRMQLYQKRLNLTRKANSLFGTLCQMSAKLKHKVSPTRLAQIQQIGIPILVLAGTEDILIRPSNSVYLHKHLGGKLKTLAGAHHHGEPRGSKLLFVHAFSGSSTEMGY